jgi:hypothetical protein
MIAVLTHWRALVAGAAGFAAAMLLVLLQHERQGRIEAERRRDEAQAQVSTARAQAELERTAGAAAIAAQTRTVHIVTRSEEAAHAVLALPGADEALPEAVRDRWAAGVLSLRDAGAGAGDADHPGG